MNIRKNFNKIVSIFIVVSLFAAFVPSSSSAHHLNWTNLEASSVGTTTAIIQGTVEGSGSTNKSHYYFEYTTNPDFTTNVTRVAVADSAVMDSTNTNLITVTKNLSGLNSLQTYYFRIIFQPDPNNLEHGSTWSVNTYFTTVGGSQTLRALSSSTSEKILDGFEVSLVVKGDMYNAGINASYVKLNNPPPGTTIGTDSDSVSLIANNVLVIKLKQDGTDFDQDQEHFSITIKEGGFAAAGSATSNPIFVKAFEEIDGYANYMSLGLSFPTKLEMSGYNTREKEVHIHAVLHTDRDAAGKIATFNYVVDVFDGSGMKIGSLGTMSAPQSAAAETAGAQEVTVKDIVVPLSSALTKEYRIVLIVKDITFN